MEVAQIVALVFTIFINLYFAILVYTRDRRSITNIFFSLLFICIDGWAISNYMYNRPGIPYWEIVFWMRLVFFTTAPLIYALSIFSLVYPSDKSPFKFRIIALLSIPAIILALISMTDSIVAGATINNGVALPAFGSGIWFYFCYVLIYVAVSMVVLLRKYLRFKGIQKSQLLYLFIGLVLLFLPATITNLLLVVLFNNVTYAPFGPMFSLLLGFFLSFAILKHRLFDITYISSVFLQYALISGFTYSIFYLVILIDNFFFKSVFSTNALLINTIIAAGYVVSIFPFRKFIEKTVVSGFEKLSNLEYLKVEINQRINKIPQLQQLADTVLELLCSGFDTKGSSLFILFSESEKSQILNFNYQFDIEILKDEVLSKKEYMDFFNGINQSYIRREWELHLNKTNLLVEKIFEKTSAEILMPIITDNRTIALLLIGEKKSEWSFTLQEIEYIADITDNFAIPLQRAMLLEDVRKFADVLQSKIDFATADLREKKAQLEEKYQFEKDMMGIMGHELRTPMTVARGMAELLIQKVSGGLEIAPDYLKEKLDRIFGSITKESDLIQTMLSSSHIDNDKVNFQSTTFDLLELIDFAMFSFRKDAEAKNLKLEFIKPKDKLPEIVSDQNRLQEIVNNLISNAIKYTNEGSIEVTLKQEGDNIRYSVKDTGLGIPANEIQNIGRKFYRIHQHLDEKKDVVRAGGTGLGLYVVKGLLDAMGGKLEIDSTENVGSTFSAIFPIVLKQSDKAMISNKPLDENDMFQKLGLSK